jgi:membrane protein DedA with SNARE-associated domain
MSGLVHGILGLPGWLVLVVAGLLVFAEDALLIGFLVPGETVTVLAGAAAALGHVPLAGVLLVVVVAAIAGDTAGYGVGRYVGPRLLRSRVLQRRRTRVEDARALLARRGGGAVFLGRWVAFLRAVIPAAAGVARMPYRRFLPWNAAGGVVWGTTVVLLGYAAGASYAQAEKSLGRDVAVVAVVVVVLVVVVWRIRVRIGRQVRRPSPDPP